MDVARSSKFFDIDPIIHLYARLANLIIRYNIREQTIAKNVLLYPLTSNILIIFQAAK